MVATVDAPADGASDLIASALSNSGGSGRTGKVSSRLIKEARETANSVKQIDEVPQVLDSLLQFVTKFPGEEAFQQCVARVLDRVQDRRAYAVWLGIDRRFPSSRDAFVRALRWVLRVDGMDAAKAYFDRRYAEEPQEPSDRLLYGRGLLELRDTEGADEVFSRIIDDPGSTEAVLTALGEIFVARGEYSRAETVAEFTLGKFGETKKIQALVDHIARGRHLLEEHTGQPERHDNRLSTMIEQAFRRAVEAGRREIPKDPRSFLGSIVLVTGGLGSGGAERQFTNTALGLHAAACQGQKIEGMDVFGPVYVICRSLHSRDGGNFFEPALNEAGLRVHQYAQFQEYAGRPRYSSVRPLSPLLPYLPAQMRDGILRLTDMLRYLDPDVVHIWQDGSIWATGLAAILAGVPRIVLGVRTMPPQDRLDRDKSEYLTVYKNLLSQPGVSLVSNSRTVAARYAAWLDLPPGSVGVIPNGVSPLDTRACEATQALAAPLANRTDETFVVGSVMRFDENKRPLLWLDVAAAVAARLPAARFVLVGSGPLLDGAILHAKSLGIADRVIFTGSSSEVGYWLSQMDAFLLLSRHEGLPNVLIEAQLAGVPVVTTPAGGAGETLKDGVTGTLLGSCKDLDVGEIASALLAWRRNTESRRELACAAAKWSNEQFSIEQMLASTVATYTQYETR